MVLLFNVYINIIMKKDNSFITESYLRKQNEELKQQIVELKQLLEYNKNALKVSINYSANNSTQEKPHQKLINNLYTENSYLKELLDQKQNEINLINTKVLISQQIVQACEDNQKSLIEQLKGKIVELKQQIKQKEKRIVELEKSSPQLDAENYLLIKYIELTSTTQITIKMNDEMELLRELLKEKQEQLQKQKQTRQEIFRLNVALTKQINDLKNYGNISTNVSKNQYARSNDINEILECHQKMFNNDDSLSEEYSEDSEEQKQKKKPPKMMVIPKLQLGKAKQIQEYIVKKINSEDKKKKGEDNGKNNQINLLKKSLNRELLKNLSLNRKLDKVIRILKQAEQQSNHLVSPKVSLHSYDNTILENQHPLYKEILELGKDVYLNENIQRVINGEMQLHKRDSPSLTFR